MDEQKYNWYLSKVKLDKLVDLSAEETDRSSCEALAEKARIIYEQYPESEDIALRYARILVNLSVKQVSVEQVNVKELGKTVNSVKQIFKQFKQSEDIALRYVMALVNLSAKQTKAEQIAEIAKEIKEIYKKFNEPQDIALYYAMALVNLSIKQKKAEEIVKTTQKIQVIYEKFEEPEDIALYYTMALVNLSDKQTKAEQIAETTQKIQVIYEKFEEPEDIALYYTMALVNLSDKQTKAEQIAETTQKIQVIYEKFEEPENIALCYAMALSNLSLKQTNLDKLNNIASKLKKIASNFEKNEDITLCYAEVLTKIITKQQNEDEKLEIIDKLKRLHNRFVQSEEITVKYLTARIDLVKNNQIDQSNLLNDIYQSLESIPSIKILNMLIEILENEEQFKQDQVQISTTNIVKALDKLCFDSSIEEGKDEKEKNLLIRTLKLGIISDTKYDILKAWIEYYGEDSKKINQLIKIYTLVQQIKYELGLKAEDKNRKLKFGHYTSGEALQSILGKKDTAPFSISGKTRLNNANYMNDPEEGVILEEILKLEKRNPLEPSSWFLMSFTSKTDDLAMWSQYGNNAEGVCIVLKENDFARYHSLSDLPWYQKNSDKQIGHKMKSSVEIQNDNSLNESESDKEKSTRGNESVQNYEDKHSTLNNDTDYLYRVAYVHYYNDQFDIEESELFTNEEVTRLKGLLEDLKSELRDHKNSEDSFYKKTIADCIEEIRYLFKSVDYKYEEELRILQYANLRSDNDKIKIDYSPEFGKLYLERKENIQIDEVIFGPKFPNPEYVTPLLKLLDKEIKYKKSTIKFR
ncbi:hypothetical protein [Streptococcus oralis]|uniref:hypothetical protein n=1 Tax=Streptococcus oralis TaxID=1303 RepID=UPI002000F2D2|nr:hypothetical protein [Streptococcus oralis]